MKSILLLEPSKIYHPDIRLPLGLLTVHEFIKSRGVKSKYVDLSEVLNKFDNSIKNIDHLELKNLTGILFHNLKEEITKYDILGISVTYHKSYDFVKSFCQIVKLYFPKKKIILGGSYITWLYMNGFLTVDNFRNNFDFLILFDGEFPLYLLLKKDLKNICDIQNLVFVKDLTLNTNRIKNNINLDILPLVKGVPDDKELYFGKEVFEYEIGRGCYWGGCLFCTFKKDFYPYKEKSVKKIIMDLKLLKNEVKNKVVRFTNDCMSVKQASDLSDEIIKEKIDLSWYTFMRFEKSLSFEILKKMKTAGCFSLRFGLESGDSKINNEILNKGIDLKDAERILKDCTRLDIRTVLFSVTGIPNETFLSALKTTKFFLKNKQYIDGVCLFPFIFLGHCAYALNPEKYKILKIIKMDKKYAFISWKGFFYRTFLMAPFISFNYFYFNMFTNTKFANTYLYNKSLFQFLNKLEGIIYGVKHARYYFPRLA